MDIKEEDDLFGGFEEATAGSSADVSSLESSDAKPNEEEDNKMRMLEKRREEEAREQANNLLASLASGDAGSFEPPEQKKPRKDADDDLDIGAAPKVDFSKNIMLHTIQTENENCTHEVAVPPDHDFTALEKRTTAPAKVYPFQLDAFQKEAILCVENNKSVLVSAHTSAGKTVVALYAIAQCLRDKQRVIYTSPIKALSNQKYRELEEEFGDVGLMTGDVTLNPDASCLVMTTEILRSMLYRGSELMREIGYVVFDEIHYMRDKERGVVWEETIILMPPNVHHVFLSATIPNARQFAQWICWLKQQECHVVYTDYRPTPLQHFVFPAGGEGLYEVVNMQGQFREDKFSQAMSGLAEAGDKAKAGIRRGKGGGALPDSNVVKIIRTIKEREMLPCIIFSFSRKECEGYAGSLKDMDFNTEEEKRQVQLIYSSAIDLLSDDDQKLPQISQFLPMLQRGIGVHHSGLLPILKEVIEILFGEGLIKTLFATETFSMGLNMPAKTVLFTSARKFDGKENRWITSGEYIQMSGRAGRRGKDDRGLVILMVDSKMSADDAKHIIKGATDPLNSQFRLTYNMVLNLMRVDGIEPEFMLERSFYQFQNQANIPILQQKIDEKEKEVHSMEVPHENDLSALFNMDKLIVVNKAQIKKFVTAPKSIAPFLHAGRLLHIVAGTRDFGWGALVDFKRKTNPDDANELIYVIEVLIGVSGSSSGDRSPASVRPPKEGEQASWEVVPMTFDCVEELAAVRVRLPANLMSVESRRTVERIVNDALKRFNNSIPLLDPVKDMGIKNHELIAILSKQETLINRSKDHELRKSSNFEKMKMLWNLKEEGRRELKALREELTKAMSVQQLTELEQRKRVLRRLQYCSQDDTIEAKGRVACELSASDELMLTEMLYGGVFAPLSTGHLVALISCFVFQENAETPKLADELSGCLRSLQEYARRIAKISNECKLELEEEKYVDSFKSGLMDVCNQWVAGLPFGEIMKDTKVFEGSIIRCLRRLEEVLREMVNAAKSMDNMELEAKLEEARTKIKRDIVFAASLYL